MSDPNLNDASESVESVDDELEIVEGADVVDEFEAADAAAGEPAEDAALHVEDESGEDVEDSASFVKPCRSVSAFATSH